MDQKRNVGLAVEIARSGKPKYVVAQEAGLHPRKIAEAVSGKRTLLDAERARVAGVLQVDPTAIAS